MSKFIFLCIFLSVSFIASTQINFGALKDKIKEKTALVPEDLMSATKKKVNESMANSRKEFDESNFNYAILFIDNSGTFENKEKGSSVGNTVSNAKSFYDGKDISNEDKAYSNNHNGELFMATNKYNLAEKSFKSAKHFYEAAGITTGQNYSQVISNLGLLYQSTGRYSKAKPYINQALELREGGDNKAMYAVSLNNKGALLKDMGDYTSSEKHFNDAIKVLDEIKDELGLALVYNNLAMSHADMAKLTTAESDMSSSLSHAKKILKENSAGYIKLLINQANIFRLLKKFIDAEKIYLSAISIKEKKLGAHPDLAHLKRGLADLYMEMGKTDQVEKLLLSAIDINKRKLGENHPSTLSSVEDLGNFYRQMNNVPKSQELLSSVVTKKKIIYGEQHPNYIQALEELALTQWLGGNINDAKANYNVVLNSTQNYINTFFNSLNENEKTLYWEKTTNRLHRYYSFVIANYAKQPDLLIPLYNTLINTKGFLLNTSSKIRNIIAQSEDAELQQAYHEWLETKENLNSAYQLSKEELAEEHVNIDSLENKANALERTLSEKSSVFKDGTVATITFDGIVKSLNPDEAVIEILEINEYTNGFTGKSKYIALVIFKGQPSLIELGASETMQEVVKTFRDKTINQKPENEAYASTWKLLDEKLIGAKRIFLSLDGLYHQLSINALKDATGKYLVDKYNIQFVGNTKDLISVKQNAALHAKPASAFLIGNPTYGKNDVIAQLPGTEAEVKNIKKILTTSGIQNTVLIGADATESSIKGVKSPSILHIATHGYFLEDLSEVETAKVLGVDVTVAKQNPLLRSGVLLANCENVFDETYRATSADNGILTAYEALSLNLDKTDLVVLSACETGLGSVKQGEGVFGLQRSFLIAGAKSIIMSLWSVSDEATMELMTLFYNNYSKSGNKQQAFADAQKQLKIKYKEPFFWAAFVMLSK